MFEKIFIIAEIGINHNGSLRLAKRLIDIAVTCKCDCVKFQIRDLNSIYKSNSGIGSNNIEQGSQYIYSNLISSNLSNRNYFFLLNYCKRKKIKTMVTPFDLTSVEFVSQNRDIIDYIKVGSPDFDNLLLLKKIITIKKKVFLSTGMNDDKEIDSVVNFFKKNKFSDFHLLHCSSSYPAFDKEINLSYIKKLQKKTHNAVGYSGHEKKFGPTILSIFLKSKIIERHLTVSKELEGPDHTSSLNPKEMKKMVDTVRKAEVFIKKNRNIDDFIKKFKLENSRKALGLSEKYLNQNVLSNKIILGKSIIYKKNFIKGHKLKYQDIDIKSPAKGISCLDINKILNKKITKNVKRFDYISLGDFRSNLKKNKDAYKFKNFKLNKKWGLIGRLGDFEDYIDNKADLLEIHLTWRELVNFKFLNKNYNKDLVIHAPEYFNDQLIDFTTENKKILDNSLQMLESVISFSKKISNNFKILDARGPRIILHPGGHYDKEIITVNKKQKYINLIKNLNKVDKSAIRLLIENMPPYPWYFGGRYYNYIFTNPLEIKKFAQETNLNVCYDVSHAQLYCNLHKIKLTNFTNLIKPHVSYLHLSDAKGFEGEGMQIGKGDVNFLQLFKDLGDMDLGFVPEIWHGHLNNSKGFKLGLFNIKKILSKISSKSSCY